MPNSVHHVSGGYVVNFVYGIEKRRRSTAKTVRIRDRRFPCEIVTSDHRGIFQPDPLKYWREHLLSVFFIQKSHLPSDVRTMSERCVPQIDLSMLVSDGHAVPVPTIDH